MADERFEPTRYVHGLDGSPVLVLPAGVAALLADRFDLDGLRLELRGVEPEACAALVALQAVASAWRARGSDCGTTTGADVDGAGSDSSASDLAAPQPALTVADVSRVTGIGGRGICKAAAKGRLSGMKVAGRWWFHQGDVEAFAASRRTRKAM